VLVEHRGKGYARTLLALCLEASFKQNINEAILFTDNPGASKAYTSIGFKRIGYYGLSLLKQPMSLSK
jgi:predicted GNAT family acetyltransferase